MIVLTGASGGIGSAILPLLSRLDNVIAISYSKVVNVNELNGVEAHQVDLASEKQVNDFAWLSPIMFQVERSMQSSVSLTTERGA